MALWYARESNGDYQFCSKKMFKVKTSYGIFFDAPAESETLDVCEKEFNKAFSKSMRLEPREGPYRLKMERA